MTIYFYLIFLGEMLAFKGGSAANLSKVLNFYRKYDFTIDAHYAEPESINYPDPFIGTFVVKNVKPTQDGEASKVKVKFRVDNSGLLVVPNVELLDKQIVEVEEPVPPVTDPAKTDTKTDTATADASTEKTQEKSEINNDAADNNPSKDATTEVVDNNEEQTGTDQPQSTEVPMEVDTSANTDATKEETAVPVKKKTKEILTNIILPVTENVKCLVQKDIDLAQEVQAQLIVQDNYQIEKANAKNSLEEYVFEMRDKLDTTLEHFVTEKLKTEIQQNLRIIDEWLYEDGDNVEPSVYKEKLSSLRIECDPIQNRYNEAQSRPAAFDKLGKHLVRFRKALDEYNAGSEEYNHLEVEEMKKVETAVNDKQQWMEKQLNLQNARVSHLDPIVKTSEIGKEAENLTNTCQPIITKPKPKPKEEPPKEVPPEEPTTAENNTENATTVDMGTDKAVENPESMENTTDAPDKGLELD